MCPARISLLHLRSIVARILFVFLSLSLSLPACVAARGSGVALPELGGLLPHRRPASEVALDRGIAAYREARWREAWEAFEEALAAGGDSFALHHYAGQAALRLGHYRRAIRELERAARMRPDDAATQNGLWQAYRGAGEAAKALIAFRRVIQLDPGQLAHLRPRTAVAARKEREVAAMGPPTHEIVFPEESDRDLLAHLHPVSEPPRSVIDPSPHPRRSSPPAGRSLIARSYSGETSSSSRAATISPAPETEARRSPQESAPQEGVEEGAATWTARGTVLARAGHYEEAIDAYQRAARLDPTNPEIYNDLGNAYFATMQIERARELYRKTLELAPDYVWAMNNLGYTYFATKEYERAIQWFQRALQRQPDHLFARMNLAVTYHDMGAYDAAIRELKRLLEDHPNTAKAYYNLGLSYTLKADYPRARKAFQTYLEMSPDAVERPYVEKILARIAKGGEGGTAVDSRE